jgi:NAD(P)-dependent dehydrogenase (short-subunit alcohol dehydrogenase family)
MYKSFRHDLERPTHAGAFPARQIMPIPYAGPIDISNAVVFFAADESRYITGMQLRVDAGGYLKWHNYHS